MLSSMKHRESNLLWPSRRYIPKLTMERSIYSPSFEDENIRGKQKRQRMFYLNTNDFIPPSCAFTGLCKSCKQTGRLLWCHSRNTRPKGLGSGTHRPGSGKAEGNVRTNHQEMVYNLDVKRNFYVPSYKSVS